MTINKWQVVDTPSSKWPKRLRADVNADSKDEIKAALNNYEYPTGTVITSKDKDYKFSFYIYEGADTSRKELEVTLSGENLPEKNQKKENPKTEDKTPSPPEVSEPEKENPKTEEKKTESPEELSDDIYEKAEEKTSQKLEEGEPSKEKQEETEPPVKSIESPEEIEADIYDESEEESPGDKQEKPVYEIKDEDDSSEESQAEAEPTPKSTETSEEIEADIYEEAEEEASAEPSAPEEVSTPEEEPSEESGQAKKIGPEKTPDEKSTHKIKEDIGETDLEHPIESGGDEIPEEVEETSEKLDYEIKEDIDKGPEDIDEVAADITQSGKETEIEKPGKNPVPKEKTEVEAKEEEEQQKPHQINTPAVPKPDRKISRIINLGVIYSLQFEDIKVETDQKPDGPPPTEKVYDLFIKSIKDVVSLQNINVDFEIAYKMGYDGIPDKTEVLQKQKNASVLVIIDEKDNLEKLESVFKQENIYVYSLPLGDIRKNYEYLNLAADMALRVEK